MIMNAIFATQLPMTSYPACLQSPPLDDALVALRAARTWAMAAWRCFVTVQLHAALSSLLPTYFPHTTLSAPSRSCLSPSLLLFLSVNAPLPRGPTRRLCLGRVRTRCAGHCLLFGISYTPPRSPRALALACQRMSQPHRRSRSCPVLLSPHPTPT